MGELLTFHVSPERKAELEAELKEHEDRIDRIFQLLGYVAIIEDPLPRIGA